MNTHALRTLVVAVGTTLAAGCSMIPTYERPAALVAAAFPAVGAAQGPAAAELPWRQFVNDARLVQLIEVALANNRDLRVAILNIEQARAQAQVRRADIFPTVNAAVSGSRTPNSSGGITSLYSAGLLTSSWEIDFFGRVASLREAALAQYLASEESRKAAQTSLVAAVASGYLALLADDELIALTQQTLATRDESVRLTKLRFDNGAASELDYRQAESLAEGARVTLAQLQRQRALDENALTLLVGQPLSGNAVAPAVAPSATPAGAPTAADAAVPAPLALAPILADVPAGLPSDLLVQRPDIRAAEQQLVASNANIGAARAAFFPRISLTAGLGTASNELSGLFKSGAWGFTLAPQALLPIFDAGRNQANLESATAARGIAIAQYEKSIQTAFREVADALAGRATLTEQLRAQQAQAQAEAVRYRLSDLRYRNGVASYLDLLDAQRSLFAARQALVQTRLAQLQNQVVLYRALGGGWDASASSAAATPTPTR